MAAGLAGLVLPSAAQVPAMLNYQGRMLVAGTNFHGVGQFKFALVQGAGPALLWKNDGSGGDSEPAAAVSLPVNSGLVMTLLGDATLANMTAIPVTVFTNSDVRLRVWFDGGPGFQQLLPDQRIVSVGYAMMASTVPDGSITAAKLAPGVLSATNLPANSVSSSQLADSIALGTNALNGRLDIFSTPLGGPVWSLDGAANLLTLFGDDGQENARLWGPIYGELLLRDSVGHQTAVQLSANGNNGGQLFLNNSNGSTRASLSGLNSGGALTLYQADGGIGVFVDGESSGAGLLDIRNTNGTTLTRLTGDSGGRVDTAGEFRLMSSIGGNEWATIEKNGSGGGAFRTIDEVGNTTAVLASQATGVGGFLHVHMGNSIWPGVVVDGDDGNSGAILLKAANDATRLVLDAYNGDGAEISLRHTNNIETVEIIASESGVEGGQLLMRNKSGFQTVQLDGDASGNGSGYLRLYKGDGSTGVTIEGDASGEGKITTQVLQITGGSDLSEQFDIQSIHAELKAGMIVCIDSENPGRLVTSSKAHDTTVAGVVSGAGGVKPGMLMGQRGTAADGQHPVALTGRVYCWVDADQGAVKPGDLITTSATPGHGMKVTDHAKAQGAVIGKAMSALAQGKGLVLVLVSLQ